LFCILVGKFFEYIGRISKSENAYTIATQYYDFVLTLFPKEVHALMGKARIAQNGTVTTQALQNACNLLLTVLSVSPTCERAVKQLCGTTMHEAAFKGQIETVIKNLNSGENSIADTNTFQHTIQHLAAYSGYLEILKLCGDNIDQCRDVNGYTPSHYAAIAGKIDVLRFMVKSDIHLCNDKEVTPLHRAIEWNQMPVFEYLVEHQQDMSKPNFEYVDHTGKTCLHWAAKFGHINFVEYLVKRGAKINAQDYEGNTPLHIAAIHNQIAVVSCLLQRNVRLDMINSKEQTAITLAASLNHTKIANIIQNMVTKSQVKQSTYIPKQDGTSIRIRNLVFQGGGVKGIAYVGALQKISATCGGEYLDDVLRVGGASAGAINALLVGLGFSINEMRDILNKTDIRAFLDDPDFREKFFELKQNISFSGIFQDGGTVLKTYQKLKKTFGLFSGIAFRSWAEKLIEKKVHKKLITFQELKKLKQQDPNTYKHIKDLYFIGTNITTGYSEIFSAEHTPDMIISDAVRISMSIPFLFTP